MPMDWPAHLTARLLTKLGLVGIIYVALLLIAGWRFYATPTGFIPAQDQGYLIAAVQMPPGMPVATVAINGAGNAGLLAAQILAVADPALGKRLDDLRASEMQKVLAEKLD